MRHERIKTQAVHVLHDAYAFRMRLGAPIALERLAKTISHNTLAKVFFIIALNERREIVDIHAFFVVIFFIKPLINIMLL